MAQNSDALQEPSMDELLASIREIIEENTGIPSQNAPQSGRPSPQFQQSGAQKQFANPNYGAAMPDLRQDIRVGSGAVQSGEANNLSSGSGFDPYSANHYSNDDIRENRDSYSNPANMPGMRNNNQPQEERRGRNFTQDRNFGAERGDFPHSDPVSARPIQDSMNALAKKIGLGRGGAPVPDNARGQTSAALRDIPMSSANQERNFPGMPNKAREQGGSGSQPHIAPIGAPQAQRSSASPNFSQSHSETGAGGGVYDDRGNAQRAFLSRGNEGITGIQDKVQGAEGHQSGNDTSQRGFQNIRGSDMPQNAGGARYGGSRAGIRRSAPSESILGAGGSFPADVEHSTEDLLRPYIAQWLDGHFKELFEKILREEVQRFIQSMRSGR